MQTFKLRCPKCHTVLRVEARRIGSQGRCPKQDCRAKFVIPAPAALKSSRSESQNLPPKTGKSTKSRKKSKSSTWMSWKLVTGAVSLCFLMGVASYWMPSANTGAVTGENTTLQAKPANEYQETIQPFFNEYCIDCHGADLQEEGIRFDNQQNPDVLGNYRFWEKVHQQVAVGSMPPQDLPAPSPEERKQVAEWLNEKLHHFDCQAVDNPGRVTVHRLNRTEYDNTIRDLLGVDLQLSQNFPSDDVGYGFDNIGDVLTTSPLLMERYITASEQAVTAAITLPEDMLLDRRFGGEDFVVSGSGHPRRDQLVFASNGAGTARFEVKAAGEYNIEIEVSASQAGEENAKCRVSLDGEALDVHEVPGDQEKKVISWKQSLPKGKRELEVAFINDHYDPEARNPKRRDRNLYLHGVKVSGPVELKREQFPETHRRLIVTTPHAQKSPKTAAREVLQPFMSKAFRRPVKDEELSRMIQLFQIAQQREESFERSIQIAMQGVLVSPQFLFRLEGAGELKPGKTYRLNDYEMASRLSYFLWSSMPDEELFELAAEGKLQNNEVLEQQVQRMLLDKKSSALVENFIGQWLGLRKLHEVSPDEELFPEFNQQLIESMQQETKLLFAHVLYEDLSLTELITADYSFLNESLANLYNVEGIKGKEFRRVSLKDYPRRGLISHAGILTLTSFPNRTSPVKRGEWVLENILAQAPPPAPASVPSLEETQNANPNLSFRDQLVLHQNEPICSSCHKLMDGIGFGMQNYDAIGRWRDQEGSHPIDARGDLPDGTSFDGPLEMITRLSQQPDHFTRCLSEKLLTYALGRGLEWYDKCTIDEIISQTRQDQYRLSRVIIEVVKSDPFRSSLIQDHSTK